MPGSTSSRLLRTATAAVLIALSTAAAGCGAADENPSAQRPPAGTANQQAAAVERANAVEAAVSRWATAQNLPEAKAAAEEARNLLTGPNVQGAGDADGDGKVEPVTIGLLPGNDGSPGLATPLATGCVETDVLGGSWDDPKARWAAALKRIDDWRPDNNTFPGFPSHAQRTVGWSTLALRATTLEEAHEYSGHAGGHAAVVTAALKDPSASPCPGG